MKCGLIHILVVAMVLGQTVSIDGFVDQWVRSLLGLTTVGGYLVPSLKRVESSTNSAIKLINELRTEFNAIKKRLAAFKFEQLDDTNTEEVRDMINNLYDIRKCAKEFRHKYKHRLVKNVDDEINALETNLEEAKQNAEDDIEQNREYYRPIHKKFFDIYNPASLRDINIQSIHNTCSEAGIKCPNIDENTSLEEDKSAVTSTESAV